MLLQLPPKYLILGIAVTKCREKKQVHLLVQFRKGESK